MSRIAVEQGDITRCAVDAIVTAANSRLAGGGGVDGAVHRAAGPELLAACQELDGCPTGEARITPAFRMRSARFVIHAVGPVWQGGKQREAELLAGAYRSSLSLAAANGCRSIAFPAISCGVYGYPVEEACRVSVDAVRRFLAHDETVQRVVLVGFDEAVAEAWRAALRAASDD